MTALQSVLLLLFIVCHSITVKAQVTLTSVLTSRNEIKIPGTYQRIEVRGDVTVVLTNEPAGTFLVEGNPIEFNKVKPTLKNGRLLINAEKKTSFEKLIVYVPITAVTALLITGEAEIFSSGTIITNGLEITLNGTSQLAVHYQGKLQISPADGYHLSDDTFSINKRK